MGKLLVSVCDEATGASLPARVYVNVATGQSSMPSSGGSSPAERGSRSSTQPVLPGLREDQSLALYDVTDPGTGIREAYAVVTRYPLGMEVAPGRYAVAIERGKEYAPLTEAIDVPVGTAVEKTFRLRRLFSMAERGWYSADCHVHTPLADLPAAQLADDVNVTFPITAWTTRSDRVPAAAQGHVLPRQGEAVRIDDTHLYWNLNTEYEITSLQDRRFILGSFMVLGHRRPLTLTCPPVKPVAEEARRQGAVIDWEKHSWPWSNMLVPVAGIDTVELSNNSMWRQRTMSCYLWDRRPMPWVGAPPLNPEQFIHYGFESYYAMLNCGSSLRPSAGTANGVHPVPLGHSRVYARIDRPFSYQKWLAAWRQGRSFATNGPMLLVTADGLEPGGRRSIASGQATRVPLRVEALSTGDLDRIELVINGLLVYSWTVPAARTGEPRHRATWEFDARIEGSSWLAVRCFEKTTPDNPRFAHTGPIFFDDPSRPLLPHRRQVDYLIADVAAQIDRCRDILPPAALAEYEEARAFYCRGLGSAP